MTPEFMVTEMREIYGIDLGSLKVIFERIIEDEEKHREILVQIKDLIGGGRCCV